MGRNAKLDWADKCLQPLQGQEGAVELHGPLEDGVDQRRRAAGGGLVRGGGRVAQGRVREVLAIQHRFVFPRFIEFFRDQRIDGRAFFQGVIGAALDVGFHFQGDIGFEIGRGRAQDDQARDGVGRVERE